MRKFPVEIRNISEPKLWSLSNISPSICNRILFPKNCHLKIAFDLYVCHNQSPDTKKTGTFQLPGLRCQNLKNSREKKTFQSTLAFTKKNISSVTDLPPMCHAYLRDTRSDKATILLFLPGRKSLHPMLNFHC